MRFQLIISILLILTASSSFATETNALVSARGQNFSLPSFELSGLYVDQGSGRNSSSAMIAWTPTYWFNETFALGGALGLSALKTTDANGHNSMFAIYDYEAFARYVIQSQWDIQLGGGAQTWGNNVGTKGIATAEFGWDPQTHLLGLIDRVFISYSRYFQNVEANEYRAGLGFLF